jgi:ketosteroid isomerase-like protein
MSAPAVIVRQFYDALGRGDVAAVLSLLDAEVEWTADSWRSRPAERDDVARRNGMMSPAITR